MAKCKSKFVPLLVNLANNDEVGSSDAISRTIFCTKEKLDAEFIFSYDLECLSQNNRYRKVTIHNVMDAFQYYQANLPSFKDQIVYMKWKTAADMFLKKVEKVVNEENAMMKAINVNQINVLAFDNSKKVCLAKKPKQNERRFEIMKYDDKAIVYSQPIDAEFVINEEDTVPANWKKYALFFNYGKAIINLFLHNIFNNELFKLQNPARQKFTVWHDGKFTSMHDTSQDEALTHKFKNMGEYDFFIIKYMKTVIESTISQRMEKESGRRKQKKDLMLHDFENLVIKLHSDDTDIMFLSLYFLEFIQTKYKISDSFLPKIIICHPGGPDASVYHVTYMYIQIKSKLEMINKNHLTTVMRSFVTAMFSWGNDILPSPANITPETWFKTYLTYSHFFNNNYVIINKSPEKEKYLHNCLINGKLFKLLYILAFSTKYLKEDQKDKIWDYYNIDGIDYRGIEMHINSIINAKKMMEKNKIPGNRTIKARMIITNIMLYSIEHALEIVPGSKKQALSDVELPEFCFTDIYEDYVKTVDPEHYQKALDMRIITDKSGIIFSNNILNLNSDEEKKKHLKLLIDNAKRIFNEFHFESWRYNIHMTALMEE